MSDNAQSREYGYHFAPEVQNLIKLTLAFSKAVGENQDDQQDNLVVSPYNHVRFLSMVAKATNGQTKEEMAQALFGVSADEMDAEIEKILTLNNTILEANKDQVVLSTATGLWANSDLVTLDNDFTQELERAFETKVDSASFAADPQGVLKDINGWASDSTNGLIQSILDSVENDMVAVLASALYFKGEWTNKFDKKLTKDKPFTTDDGTEYKTAIMEQFFKEDDVMYQDGDDYEAVALTYGEDNYREGKYPSMRIVLVKPKDDAKSAREWMAEQADGSVPAWLDPYAFESAEGYVKLPHIDIEQEHDLKPAFNDAGISTVLSPSADFSNMVSGGPGRMELSEVKENIVFKTDEEGSEAASIVSGVIRATSVRMPPKQINVELNRSFVLAVQDVQTGAVLFTGAVNKPNGKMSLSPQP